MTHADLPTVLDDLAGAFDAHRAALAEFVAIPSVSTDPAYADDVRHAADWIETRLCAMGDLRVERIDTPRHPAVLASWDGAPGAPTVLVYGHMDVQPPDPLDAWASPPFELDEREGRWYARGISDDKASMLIPILVTEAFFRHGTPPVNLRLLFEAEEEIGSPHLPEIVRSRAGELGCDVVLSADGGMWKAELPALTTRARGMTGLELRVRTAAKDLHSGRHGGAIHNPTHALARIVASLHDDAGRVAVEGFHDGVAPPSEARLAELDRLPFDEATYLHEVGAPAAYGEPGYGTLARQWLRPTVEVNGLGGGYQGPGSKTVLPQEAFAKITCRLVPGQDPDAVLDVLERHLHAVRPPGVTLTISRSELGAPAYVMPDDHPFLHAAEAVLEDTFGQRPVRVGMGGSVPIAATFAETLGADTLFFSFSTADENIHAPNEFYRPERFVLGLEAWARLWHRLAASPPPTSS